jgi:hypothetical protein
VAIPLKCVNPYELRDTLHRDPDCALHPASFITQILLAVTISKWPFFSSVAAIVTTAKIATATVCIRNTSPESSS